VDLWPSGKELRSRFQVHALYISHVRVERKSLAVEDGSLEIIDDEITERKAVKTAGAMAAALAVMFCGPALAHGAAVDGSSSLWASWSSDPLVIVPLVVSCCLYVKGVFALRRRLGRLLPGFGPREILCFTSGSALLIVALVSPLESLAEPLLSAHMVQHILLVTMAPPLLVLGKPEVAWLWALPDQWRRSLPRQKRMRSVLAFLSPCARPIPAAVIHSATLWVWHSPALFDAALEADWLHWLEHLLFFGTALLFWRAVIKASSGREAAAAALIACFITLLQSGLLSALLSFAREALYKTPETDSWGLSALEDQQLAGAIMSIPMCIIYLIAGLVMAARLLTPPISERSTASTTAISKALKQSP
jgi:cytochrome c oxidase assembly factor CtaG